MKNKKNHTFKYIILNVILNFFFFFEKARVTFRSMRLDCFFIRIFFICFLKLI